MDWRDPLVQNLHFNDEERGSRARTSAWPFRAFFCYLTRHSDFLYVYLSNQEEDGS